MKVLNRSNIFFFITVILLSVMIFYTKHDVLTFLSDAMSTADHLVAIPPFPLIPMEIAILTNTFTDVVIFFTSLFIMWLFFFSDKQLRIFLWCLVLTGIVIMSVAMLLLKNLTGI